MLVIARAKLSWGGYCVSFPPVGLFSHCEPRRPERRPNSLASYEHVKTVARIQPCHLQHDRPHLAFTDDDKRALGRPAQIDYLPGFVQGVRGGLKFGVDRTTMLYTETS